MGCVNHKKKSMSVKAIQMLSFLGVIFLGSLLSACSETNGEQDQRKKEEKSAITFIRNDDCLNCHNIEDKSVGPSYVQVAQKYEADFSTVNRLADKIIEGGGGMWGSDQMSKHPFLKKGDARKIVRWILSLSDTVAIKSPMIHTPSITLSKVFQENTAKKENGLKISAYSSDQLGDTYTDDFPEIPSDVTPLYSGLAKFIHLTHPASFQPLQERFVLRASGFIHIGQRGKYFFKLVKAGKGRVFLNEEEIINDNDWDNETVVDLMPGTYPIAVEYLTAQKKNTLSLQWIIPSDEYYQVVPEEVFVLSN